MVFYFSHVSGAASGESRQTMVALRMAGHSEFLLKRGADAKQAQKDFSPGLRALQGKGHVRQEALPLT